MTPLEVIEGHATSPEEYWTLEVAAAVEQAESNGFTVVHSDPTHLLLDLDTASSVAQYNRVLPILQRHIAATEKRRWLSKSGNLHVVLELDEALPIEQRLLLQAALGSDGVREVLSLIRSKAGIKEPSKLFKPAYKHVKGRG